MKSLVCLCLTGVLLLAACSTPYVDTVTDENNFRGYLPVEPIPVDIVRIYDASAGRFRDTNWACLTTATRLSLLPLQTAEVSVKKLDANARFSYVGSSAEVGIGSYEVIMDYMKYRVDTVVTSDSVLIGSRRVGVGLRMTARVQTSKAGISIAGLGALAVEASLEHLNGSLSVNVIGIDSRDVTNLIPITSQLDQTSIESALQALAAVKTKMWDMDETTITPHIIAVQQRIPGSVDAIIQEKSYQFQRTSLGDCIRDWWKPGGRPDPARTDSLRTWLTAHASAGAPESITDLISGGGLDEIRNQVVRDLGISCDD